MRDDEACLRPDSPNHGSGTWNTEPNKKVHDVRTKVQPTPVPKSIMSLLPQNRFHSDDSCSHGTPGMATTLVAFHVAAHAEGLAATGVSATEGLLAGVAVRVDTERRGP